MIFNDADGCFDQIPPNLANLVLMRLGCPGESSNTCTIVQRKMKHHIKTSHGVSLGYIQFNPNTQKQDLNENETKLSGPGLGLFNS